LARHVYLVGTIGLDTAGDVFNHVGRALGQHVWQISDFGIASRCGIACGRLAATVSDLLQLHAELADI
jgi:hypothetical protein